jgi:hypothetical protein
LTLTDPCFTIFGNQGEDETKTKEEKCEDFDDILDIIGSQGRFQKFFLYAVLGPITTIEPILNLNILFMLYEPDHWCSVAGRPENATVEAWKNLTIPRSANMHSYSLKEVVF